MEAHLHEWLNLVVRWIHFIVGIAWIGASFYFNWLENNLDRDPPQDAGIAGNLWAIHGGGIYEVGKYQLAPEKMPETLHWFKWEAYSTWLTGMVLLVLVFYVGADAYLIDSRVMALSQWQAIGLGLGFLVAGWLLYEGLCATPFARSGYALGFVLILFAVIFSYALTHVFSGRGAYIHMGAVIGTIMAGNVFRVIMPSQRALVAAIEAGTAPDPAWGARAKLRSTHNNYLTLPLLFIMISNHYPMTYAHHHNWLVLLAIIAITAFARHYFNLRHRGVNRPWIIAVSLLATAALAWAIMPMPRTSTNAAAGDGQVAVAEVERILVTHCAGCHAREPTDDVFQVAPGGVLLENLSDMQQWAARIKARAVDSHDMPFLNKTGMSEEERALVGRWIDAGAPPP